MDLYLGMVAGGGGGSGAGGDKNTRTLRLYDVTTAWHGGVNGTTGYTTPGFGGTGHGFPANPGDPTWLDAAFGSVAWNTPGGDFAPSERAALAVGTIIDGAYSWSTADTAAGVQDLAGRHGGERRLAAEE